jgi:hypothetical protein
VSSCHLPTNISPQLCGPPSLIERHLPALLTPLQLFLTQIYFLCFLGSQDPVGGCFFLSNAPAVVSGKVPPRRESYRSSLWLAWL